MKLGAVEVARSVFGNPVTGESILTEIFKLGQGAEKKWEKIQGMQILRNHFWWSEIQRWVSGRI
jgi:hypothetical protein